MYKHILVPTDGSRQSEDAAATAIRLAKTVGARLSALHVVPEPATTALDAWTHDDAQFKAHLEKVLEARGREYLETVREAALKAGVPCDCVLVHGDSPHAGIVAEARGRGCDLIVMASHGRKGTDAVLLASETIKVMTLGATPVLVHHGAGAARPQPALAG